MSVLLLVCLFQASVMWRFIHFQLRRWREYWNEQSSRKRAAAAAAGAKQQAKPLKRDSGEHGRALGWHRVHLFGICDLAAAARGGDAAVLPLAERGVMSQGPPRGSVCGSAPRGLRFGAVQGEAG